MREKFKDDTDKASCVNSALSWSPKLSNSGSKMLFTLFIFCYGKSISLGSSLNVEFFINRLF